MSVVSSAYLTRTESFPAALRCEEYTVYSTGPMPDPCTIFCVIVYLLETLPFKTTDWVRSVRKLIIQLQIWSGRWSLSGLLARMG